MGFARNELQQAFDELAREIAGLISAPTQPYEPLLRVAIALARMQPRMASALAASIGPNPTGMDESIAMRTVRFVIRSPLAILL